MMIILGILLIFAALFLGYLFCIGGRTGHPGLKKLSGWNYAHRGLHDDQLPENSMGAFRAALDAGCGIELDIHLMKDGNLAVIHDASLLRTAGADVRIEDLTIDQLKEYRLGNTMEQIPLFQDVLTLFDGKAPLIVELKCVDGNYAQLCEATCKLLDGYSGVYCLESFDPRVVRWLRSNRPDLIRGQLSENWMGKPLPVPAILKWAMTYHIANVYTRPDFIAYKYADRKVFGTDICRKWMGVQGVTWTLRSREEYDQACSEGWIPIFENFRLTDSEEDIAN